MAKDFFSDIRNQPEPQRPNVPAPAPAPSPATPDRSIRNISVPARRVPISSPAPRVGGNEIKAEGGPTASLGAYVDSPPRRSRLLIWLVAVVAVVILAGAVAYVFLGDTVVTVTPRTHQITFDDSTQFTAYPAATSAAGTIAYTTESIVLTDSATVPATGTEQAQDKATGTITVYNDYSSAPVRLIKNTRFQSPGGMIFRIPASVEVPGKKGSTSGQISVTVIADQPGESYNIAPADKFTLPGLKSTPEMYTGVWGRSTETFSGGFSGTKPAIQKDALDKARSDIRARLEEKARSAVAERNSENTFAFYDLSTVLFESLPTTPEATGSAKVNEKVTITIPLFSKPAFAGSIASAVSADAEGNMITLTPGAAFGAKIAGDQKVLGQDPLTFTLSGNATLVWSIDPGPLSDALAGKDQGAFETVIGSFPSIEKAEASIAPFWRRSFPADPADIKITVVEPTAQ